MALSRQDYQNRLENCLLRAEKSDDDESARMWREIANSYHLLMGLADFEAHTVCGGPLIKRS